MVVEACEGVVDIDVAWVVHEFIAIEQDGVVDAVVVFDFSSEEHVLGGDAFWFAREEVEDVAE